MAVIGGLIVSTLLSLVFVPSVYVAMDDVSRRIALLRGRVAKPDGALLPLGGEMTFEAGEAD
jgi:hypothetical protein